MLLLLATAAAAAPQIDPAFAQTNVVYHVNPHAEGAIPVNMDTGDATGDLLFDLFEVIINPLACPNGSKSGHGCTNPEASGQDLMVNKLTVEVDSRYSGYAKCNIGVNGTDGRGHPCKDGTYCCFCEDDSHYGHDVPCNATVGIESLFTHFGNGHTQSHANPHGWGCDGKAPASRCYIINAFKKMSFDNPGYWYSSLESGYCGNPKLANNATCTWRVVAVEKIVTRDCHSKVFGAEVLQHGDKACIDACGTQKTNTSSPCWVDCFYKAALGPDSGKVGGKVEGMPLQQLRAAWEKPFLPVDQGGCAPQKEMPSWYLGA